ncbi:MAG: hypothetical protein QOF79_1168 [Actinomycetota bacterium]|nr:hypothetical protein [Actinomycetota bacterium]
MEFEVPSFRVTLTIGAVDPNVDPSSILPRAAAAVREFTTVEAFDVGVVSGTARITVRFTADDGEVALQIGRHVANTLRPLAEIVAAKVTERVGGRWYLVQDDR